MSEVMERIKDHFKDQLHGEREVIEVPEWGSGGESLKIYYRPINLKQQNQVFKYIREGSLESLVQQLILCARDEDDKPIFRQADKTELMNHADPKVLGRVVKEMQDFELSAEVIEKN